MKILVLGGCGIQGRTVLHDLASDKAVAEILCADIRFDDLSKIKDFTDMSKIQTIVMDAQDKEALIHHYQKVDVVIDLLPRDFKQFVNQAALEAKVSVVNTNYDYTAGKLDQQAKAAGIAVMPECGLDPGIDLILYGHAKKKFDELQVIQSYCGGFPEKKACTNPLNYKLSWIWKGVLSSTLRESRIIKDKKIIEIPAMNQHDDTFVHTIDFPGLGELEAIPNGDSVYFTNLMGLSDTIVQTGRYALRWPGWSAFWRPMKQLGFLSDDPVAGLACAVTPMEFLDKFLGPQLAYKDDEKDLTAMINIFEGIKDKKKIRFTSTMLIERDLDTGIMAMSKGVGYTAAIVARMIARGDITEKGVLSPLKHIPAEKFMNELKKRGIQIKEETIVLEE
ncbi:MAG: saccharopine dehydrogenase NADP-binding domain-containing protein [Proteobacteria bacterium]|nr:saccharopine dehydrogenase NADP-binding domain-containing protein [Pseudomonadota bacterium]MBU1583888.1 saccharopine dehydrogenase NADP-binding domain-containing protein [Pseudomonadota bacterium]MBU2453396.1 saccharopine dehydrogenase NADP-binding domain-containing protein [Pseudomonadota bacterium]MBU2628032.1 saccharopine dehydrogenase NADP-binding domain-containing protein [Pseudomonadota bacterium]